MEVNQESGFSLVETFFTIFLGAILLASTALAAKSTLQFALSFNRTLSTADKVEAARLTLKRGADLSQMAYGVEAIKIHLAGQMRDVYGELLPIHQPPSLRSPKNGSDAISYLHLEPNYLLVPLSRETLARDLYCLNTVGTPVTGVLSREWLVITTDGQIEARARLRRRRSSSAFCPDGEVVGTRFSAVDYPIFGKRLSSQPRPSLDWLILDASNILAAFPIAERYAIYVDNAGTLRRLDHQNDTSQPLEYEFESLGLSWQLSALGRTLATTLKIKDEPKTINLYFPGGPFPQPDIFDALP